MILFSFFFFCCSFPIYTLFSVVRFMILCCCCCCKCGRKWHCWNFKALFPLKWFTHSIIIACLRHDYLYIFTLIYFDSKSIHTYNSIQFNTRTHNHAPFTATNQFVRDVLARNKKKNRKIKWYKLNSITHISDFSRGKNNYSHTAIAHLVLVLFLLLFLLKMGFFCSHKTLLWIIQYFLNMIWFY